MRLEAHYRPEGILLRVQADHYEQANDVRKQVTASRYVKRESAPWDGLWAFRYPLSADKCIEMREAWGAALKVHRDLGAWYRQAVAQRQEQVSRAAQTDAELRVVPARYPDLATWLFGDQRVTATWMADLYRGGGLLADEMGVGKTPAVVAGLIEAEVNGPTLILCPKVSVKSVWGKEFARHTPDVPVFLARGTRKKREKAISEFRACPNPFKVLVCTIEMVRIKAVRSKGRVTEFIGHEYPELFADPWACIVVDESQRVMGSMDVVKGNLAGEGLKDLPTTPDRLKLAVSATPFGKGGRVEAMFGTLHWLWPDEFPSKWAWLRKYFEVDEDTVFVKGGRGATKTVHRVGRLKDEDRMWRELGPRVLRRTLEEVSPAHRGLKHFIEVPCEMEPRQAAQYAQFAQDAELAVEGGIVSTVGVLDFMTRCRQFANGVLRKEGGRVVYTGESGKLDKLLLLLERHADRKVVISSQYNEYLDAVEARLAKEGYRWYRLDGSTTDTRREQMMEEFQGGDYLGTNVSGEMPTFTGPDITCRGCNTGRGRKHGVRCPAVPPRLFLLNGQAGGVSITLDAADIMMCLDEMYPPEANTQLYGRCFRRSRIHEVIFYLFRSMGTIDEVIGTNVGARHEEQLKVLDGRRGLEYIRKLAQYREDD